MEQEKSEEEDDDPLHQINHLKNKNKKMIRSQTRLKKSKKKKTMLKRNGEKENSEDKSDKVKNQ